MFQCYQGRSNLKYMLEDLVVVLDQKDVLCAKTIHRVCQSQTFVCLYGCLLNLMKVTAMFV